MPNSLTIETIAPVVNAVLTNAQGGSTSADTSDFTTIAQIALQQGYDPLTTAITQVISKTVFAYRPYERKFSGLYMDSQRWGNHVRKLNPIDKPLEDDNQLFDEDGTILADGDSLDMYTINKPQILQTNFYGAQSYQKSLTIYKHQLDTAFSNENEFARFLTMVMGSVSDQLEQARENLSRGTVANLIGGTYTAGRVIKLLTLYNAATGLSLTATTVMQPANYKPFMQWCYGELQTIIDRLAERSYLHHTNPYFNGAQQLIMRHTPKSKLKMYMFADFINKSETMAIAETFHDSYLKKIDYEKVTFWQELDDPQKIDTTVNYLGVGSASADGAIATAAFDNSNIVGVLFDEDAAGVTLANQWSGVTPFNVKGGYTNQFWHETSRHFVDSTENAIVLALE